MVVVRRLACLSDDDFIVASATQRIWALSYNTNTAELSIS